MVGERPPADRRRRPRPRRVGQGVERAMYDYVYEEVRLYMRAAGFLAGLLACWRTRTCVCSFVRWLLHGSLTIFKAGRSPCNNSVLSEASSCDLVALSAIGEHKTFKISYVRT